MIIDMSEAEARVPLVPVEQRQLMAALRRGIGDIAFMRSLIDPQRAIVGGTYAIRVDERGIKAVLDFLEHGFTEDGRIAAEKESHATTQREGAHALRVARQWQTRAERAEQIIDLMATGMDDTDKQTPEDEHVAAICDRYGYGAVMDAAARLWARKDPLGAITTGVCRGTIAAVVRARKP